VSQKIKAFFQILDPRGQRLKGWIGGLAPDFRDFIIVDRMIEIFNVCTHYLLPFDGLLESVQRGSYHTQ
jgi:GTP cyclohydrolase I